MDEQRGEASSALERLIFLSDGVFAIAMTLLVVQITLPELGQGFAVQEAALPGALIGLLPQIATYALSFLIIAIYWMTHQRLFRYITRVDSGLIWLSVFFLMGIAFLPVPTNVVGRYGDHGAAVRFYSVSLLFVGLFNALLWWYAMHNRRLVPSDLDAGLIRHHRERSLLAPAVFLLSFGLSYLNPFLAEASLVLIWVAMATHERLYRRRKVPVASGKIPTAGA